MKTIEVQTGVFERNDQVAEELGRELKARGIRSINLIGSPGAGKTSLLEALIERLPDRRELVVVEGDLYTDKDARRMAALGVRSVQLNTLGACHLEAHMIRQGLGELDLGGARYVVIDNIGNLVCTAEFALGEDLRVCVQSVTEGNDKPLKYPLIFQTADLIVLNKMDLVDFTDFDVAEFERDVRSINPKVAIIKTSARLKTGIAELGAFVFGS
jgi:hydrogenase nickel incorporation protein HypB